MIEPYGEAAFLVTLGVGIDPAINARVHRLAAAVRSARDAANGGAWGHPVPAYASLLVPFDPQLIAPAVARRRLTRLVAVVEGEAAPDAEASAGPTVELATRYGGPDGPDLAAVASRLGLAPADVVALHAGTVYRVFMLGFTPGFAYLGPLPTALRLSRRARPRQRVPAGSVGIADEQTGVYPTVTPGGWHLIGRTEVRLWDPEREPPALVQPGWRVRFVPLAP